MCSLPFTLLKYSFVSGSYLYEDVTAFEYLIETLFAVICPSYFVKSRESALYVNSKLFLRSVLFEPIPLFNFSMLVNSVCSDDTLRVLSLHPVLELSTSILSTPKVPKSDAA